MLWRLLSSLLVALALFFTPLAMADGPAAAHGATVAASDVAGHCADSGDQGRDDHMPGQTSGAKARCMVVCAAVPSAPVLMAERTPSPKVALAMPCILMLTGIAPEHDTPPPRFFPEI